MTAVTKTMMVSVGLWSSCLPVFKPCPCSFLIHAQLEFGFLVYLPVTSFKEFCGVEYKCEDDFQASLCL